MLVIKKDVIWRLFLCLLVFLTADLTYAANLTATCSTALNDKKYDELAEVRYVHDGDTLNLRDGRKIRLIGVNTPELARDHKAAEAYADEAKDALSAQFKKNKSVGLVFGNAKKDHYGRYLAHVFSAERQNVQASLLTQGYAYAITFPPNTQYAKCYLALEKQARCNQRGLWKNNAILPTRDLKKSDIGFHLIQGKVKNIRTTNKGIWLNLDDKLTVGIRPADLSLFDIKKINSMLNQSIIARGWLNENDRSTPFYIRVRHPLSIQLSSDVSCH